jgi:hypothetical protein
MTNVFLKIGAIEYEGTSNMRPRDWFSVGVRLLGVWLFAERGFSYFLTFGADRLNLSDNSPFAGGIDPSVNGPFYLWYALGCTALSAYFIFGADHLTRLAFRESISTDEKAAS